MRAGEPTPAATVTIDIIGDRHERRVVISHRGGHLSLALCGCSPRASALEVAATLEWCWNIPADETFPALLAALCREAAA